MCVFMYSGILVLELESDYLMDTVLLLDMIYITKTVCVCLF